MVEDLKFIHKTGRISTIGMIAGTAIGVRPIFKLSEEVRNFIAKINYHTYSKSVSGNKNLSSRVYNGNYEDNKYKLWMSEICFGSGEPVDFDSFWSESLTKARLVPLRTRTAVVKEG